MKVFDRDHITGDDPGPDNLGDKKELRKTLPCLALDMKKLFPMGWTKEVHKNLWTLEFANLKNDFIISSMVH